MNAEKTGTLIKQLRLNKNLTQAQLAELVFVSDKAVSKWERGDGCPDITILPKLAEVLCVQMENLMEGEIPKSQDISKMQIKDYNFRQPDRYPQHIQKDIAMMGDEICKKINKIFSSIMNEFCELSILGVDQMINIEFLHSIPSSCFFYDFNYHDNGFCIEVDKELGKYFLKQDTKKFSSITDFDFEVLKNYFIKEIANAMGEEISANTKGSIDSTKFSVSKAHSFYNTSILNQEDRCMMLLLTLKCKVDNQDSYMNIQLSEGLLKEMTTGGFFSDGYSSKLKIQILSNVKNKQLPDNIFVEFGRFHTENVSLEIGKVLVLDKKESEGLNVVFNNKVIHTGKTITADEHFGIEILESHQLNEIIYDETDYISIQLGSTVLKEEEINLLHQGSYIILNQIAGSPSHIIRSGKIIGNGEIVIADKYFAIRVTEIM